MTTIEISSSQKALVQALVESKDHKHAQMVHAAGALSQFHHAITHNATFRQLRRAADQIGLKWEGTSNSDFKIILAIDLMMNPVYNPGGQQDCKLQQAFAKAFNDMGTTNQVIADPRFFRVTMEVENRYSSMVTARHELFLVDCSIDYFMRMVEKAVIQKNGWTKVLG
jgi:hypothetical protein